MQGLICGPFDERDVYMELIHRFPLKPILDDFELETASRVIDELLECEKLSEDAKAYMIVLEVLIANYEAEHHAIPPLPDNELLRQLLDVKGVTQVELARATGIVESTISAILSGRRELTREQIGKLSRYFGISPDTFAFGE